MGIGGEGAEQHQPTQCDSPVPLSWREYVDFLDLSLCVCVCVCVCVCFEGCVLVCTCI